MKQYSVKWKKEAIERFPNLTRTNAQRRVRYCFLRQIGLSRTTARALEGWRDINQARFLEHLNELLVKI